MEAAGDDAVFGVGETGKLFGDQTYRAMASERKDWSDFKRDG